MEGYGNENPGAFQSTRPLRGATATTTSSVVHALFQPMRPLRGATAPLWRRSRRSRISTHAPLAGRDSARSTGLRRWLYFNPRAPCGARPEIAVRITRTDIFQPPRPLRGATDLERAGHMMGRYFNPRAPCGARPGSWQVYKDCDMISTHAPLAGRDLDYLLALSVSDLFQPTRPLRGATFHRQKQK